MFGIRIRSSENRALVRLFIREIYVISYTGTGKRTKNKVFVNYFYCREYKKGGKKKGQGSHCSVSRSRENDAIVPLTALISESSLSPIVFPNFDSAPLLS